MHGEKATLLIASEYWLDPIATRTHERAGARYAKGKRERGEAKGRG